MIAKRSPPTPTFIGSTTLSTAAAATAASMALPPCFRTCSPAWAASGWLVVTMPCWAKTSARDWAAQPSVRSPRIARQAAGFDGPSQVESSGAVCARAVEPQAIAIAAAKAMVFILVPLQSAVGNLVPADRPVPFRDGASALDPGDAQFQGAFS